jgi:hypothetical protein
MAVEVHDRRAHTAFSAIRTINRLQNKTISEADCFYGARGSRPTGTVLIPHQSQTPLASMLPQPAGASFLPRYRNTKKRSS